MLPTVLSWDGDVSAISQDAIEDVRQAKFDTVIDEWDEDFDRGKVSKTLSFFFIALICPSASPRLTCAALSAGEENQRLQKREVETR